MSAKPEKDPAKIKRAILTRIKANGPLTGFYFSTEEQKLLGELHEDGLTDFKNNGWVLTDKGRRKIMAAEA